MKQLIRFTLMLLALLLPATATAYDFEVDGIYYNIINGNEAEVTTLCNDYGWLEPISSYSGDVTIPSTVTYDGTTYPVTSIGWSAFYFCTALTSVTIPNSVTTIGSSAFYCCHELTSVTIPNSVTTIGSSAFNGCNGLRGVTIPNSVTTIGSYAFADCDGLRSVTIGSSVTTIGDKAFFNCNYVNNGDGYSYIGLSKIFCLASIPPTIYENTFSVSDGNDYFSVIDCYNADEVYVPTASVEAYQAADYWRNFSNFRALSHNFELDGIRYETTDGVTASVVELRYSNGWDLEIPETVTDDYYRLTLTVTEVADGASDDPYLVQSVTSMTIPKSVTSIGSSAFSGCSGLTSVTCLASTPPTIKSYYDAFTSFVTSRATLYVPNESVSAYQSAYNWKDFSRIVGIDDFEVDGVWYRASEENTAMVIKRPGEEDYYQGDVVIPKTFTYNGTTYSVTTIGSSAFSGCTGLTSVTIPNSVTTIGTAAFRGCSGLTSVTIPNSVTKIGSYAFADCDGLMKVTIGSSVTTIGWSAFNGCSGLTSVTIPNSVTTIGGYAFSGCRGLTSVTCLASTPPTIYYAFPSEVTSQATLYVPNESVSAYQSAYDWKKFSRIVGITVTPAIVEFEVDGVWYRALEENTAMVIQRPGEEDYYQGDMVIPESVTYEDQTFTVVSIDAGAFEDCYDLTSVVIGDAVESIGENAFQGCTALTSVTIGSGVTAIGTKAFNYCNALQTVTCLGMVPPVMASSNCFTNATYNRATLRLPRPVMDAYIAADYWYKFVNVAGFGSAGPGDVDGDGVMNISDVTTLIDALLDGNYDSLYFDAADLNSNGRIDITDVTTLIDYLLNGSWN